MTVPPGRRYLDCGDAAVLVETADLASALASYRALVADRPEGVVDAVPAARTVLVRFDPALTTRDELIGHLDGLVLEEGAQGSGREVEVPVHYDGEDLDEVARLTGLDRSEVIRRHTAAEHRVAFAGFAPGFVYIAGSDPALRVPRRSTPRTRIPAGAVGLAGEFSGVYPRVSPGGWQLIGTTDLAMWDLARPTPALLLPGDRVRFTDAGPRREAPRAVGQAEGETATAGPGAGGPALEVLRVGTQALLEDRGRRGASELGVTVSGALDVAALAEANRLAGNPPDEAAIELAYGGLAVRAHGELVVAVAGARLDVAVRRRSGRLERPDRPEPIALGDGETLELGTPSRGIRDYLAVRGGFAVPEVVGSRSSDTLASLGPAPVSAGDVLPVRADAGPGPAVGHPGRWSALPDGVVPLPVRLGPRDDWFTAAGIASLFAQDWTVTPQSNRSGLRLAGDTPLERHREGELPSEGTVPGALQVPASGQPILFLADHPLTGGYPVVAVLATAALAVAAQLPIGARIRFIRMEDE